MGLHGLPRSREGTGRRRDVAGQRVVVPRHLHRIRPGARQHRRGVRTGAHRPVRHQAAHGTPPEDAVLQRHLRRRPDVGDRSHRRTLQRRPHEGDQDLVPFPADALQPRPVARAQPHDPVEPRPAAGIQGFLRQGFGRHQLDPVRERRADARSAPFGRLRHRLLRIVPGHRPPDPVLRRALQPGQGAAAGHQRRPLREHRHADGQGHPGALGGPAALRGGDAQLQDGADRNRPRLQRGDEHHPLHARQVLLREGPDGVRRHRPAHQPRLRRGRAFDRPRLALGHQICQGDHPPQRRGAHAKASTSRANSPASATTTTA